MGKATASQAVVIECCLPLGPVVKQRQAMPCDVGSKYGIYKNNSRATTITNPHDPPADEPRKRSCFMDPVIAPLLCVDVFVYIYI